MIIFEIRISRIDCRIFPGKIDMCGVDYSLGVCIFGAVQMLAVHEVRGQVAGYSVRYYGVLSNVFEDYIDM